MPTPTKDLSEFTKLSDLAEAALADLEAVEKDERYVVDMESWHEPADGVCMVCLAGAVMANRLVCNPTVTLMPSMLHEAQKLRSLNLLRMGIISGALEQFGITNSPLFPYAVIANYAKNRDQFFADMRGIITLLREHGY